MRAEPKRRGLLTLSRLGTAEGRRDAWRPVVEGCAIQRAARNWAAWVAEDGEAGEAGLDAGGPGDGPSEVRCGDLSALHSLRQAGCAKDDSASEASSDERARKCPSSTTGSTCSSSKVRAHKEFLTCSFTKAGYADELESSCDWAAWACKEPGSVASGARARIPFAVDNTFVTVKPSAPKRRASCPPRVSQSCTVMLRNLPNRAKARRIEEHLHNLGFKDFGLYLPLDPRTGVNKGYVFIRLQNEATAVQFIATVHHTRLPDVPGSRSTKKLTAAFAADQGTLRSDRGGQHRCLWPRTAGTGAGTGATAA